MRESTFQSRLIKDLRANKIRTKKLQSGMGYTVLDLYIKPLYHHGMWIELKTIPSLGTKVDLTELQRKEIREARTWNEIAACIVCVPVKLGATVKEELYWFDVDDTHVRPEGLLTTRQRGQQYDTRAIIDGIVTRLKG